MKRYEVLTLIGEGAYGSVYKARRKCNNEMVAIKKFKDNIDKTNNHDIKRTIVREIKMLQCVQKYVSKYLNLIIFEHSQNKFFKLAHKTSPNFKINKFRRRSLISERMYENCKISSTLYNFKTSTNVEAEFI